MPEVRIVRLSLPFAAVLAVAALLTPAAAPADTRFAPLPLSSGEPLRLSAPRPVATDIASQPGPIKIDGCFSDARGADGLTLVHHALRITNGGDRAITAVRIRFGFTDAFGDVTTARTNIAELRAEPGQTVDRVSLTEVSDAGPPARITCSVDAIRYADGSIARTGVR